VNTDNNAILAAVDGSLYTDSVCAHAAWASRRLDAPVKLMYVQSPGSEHAAPADLSGTIGLGAKSGLLEKLTQVDEERGKLDQKKGKLILAHTKEVLLESGVNNVQTLHRRGSLVETITELEASAQMNVLGKRGEQADFATLHLGSNLERVVRAAHNPVLVAARAFKAINRFVIAFDGGSSTLKALDYVIESPLFQGLECHLLRIGQNNEQNRRGLEQAATRLQQADFSVETLLQQGDTDEVISAYARSNGMDLLVMGAYGHSHFRTMFIGSTTSSMLRSCPIPVLMFR
jgi:nucleotide-binding universal stress UspA family protein